MKTNSTRIKIGAAIIVWSFMLLAGSSLGSTVQAQYPNNGDAQSRRYDRDRRGRNWDNYGNYGGSSDLRQTALNAGYNEGMKDGADARQRNRNSDYRNQSDYRKATKDYSSHLGDRELYRRYFREAYEIGYNDGLNPQDAYDNNRNRGWNPNNYPNNNPNNYPNNNGQSRRGRNWDRYETYGGSAELRQTALNAGYNEGIKEGRKNNRSDYRNNSAYQKATTDYSSKLGDRGLYQRYYRAGYENGYNDGLNGN